MFAIVVSTLCIAPMTASAAGGGLSAGRSSSVAPLAAQDGMNETTTDDGMGNETMANESMSGESTMNETTMTNESMGDAMNETTMVDGNMSDGMNETAVGNSTTESMGTNDGEMMDETTTATDEQMTEGGENGGDGDGTSAFAPGFGVLTALLAVAAVALYVARGG